MPEWRIGYSSIKILFSSVCPFKSWRGCVVFIWYSTGWRRPTRGLRTSWGMPRAPGSSTRGCPSRRRAETEIRRVQMSKLLYKFCRMITKERDEGIGRLYAHFFYAFSLNNAVTSHVCCRRTPQCAWRQINRCWVARRWWARPSRSTRPGPTPGRGCRFLSIYMRMRLYLTN